MTPGPSSRARLAGVSACSISFLEVGSIRRSEQGRRKVQYDKKEKKGEKKNKDDNAERKFMIIT
jgi:hypothetical protein